MKNYCGNKEPFVYVFLSKADESAGRPLAEALEKAGYKLYVSPAFTDRDRRVMKKAAAAVLVMSSGTLGELSPAVSAAAELELPLIPVYLDPLTLPPGMRMLLGPKQAHARKNYPDEESFLRELTASPVLSGLQVTQGQKKAARSVLFGAVGAAAAVIALAVLLTLGAGAGSKIAPGSALSELGLSGNAAAVKSVYLYGAALRDGFEAYGAQDIEGGGEGDRPSVYLPGEGVRAERGALRRTEDFAQLVNVEELSLAGNALEDLTPVWTLKKLRRLDLSCNLGPVSLAGIGALENLTELNLCYSQIVGGWEELAALPKLSILWLSSEDLPRAAALAERGVELRCPSVTADTWEELKAASETEWVYHLCFRGDGFLIPAGETLTVRENVHFGSEPGSRLENAGTVELWGYWGMGMTEKDNRGTVVVRSGGVYASGMGRSRNYGEFVVEPGGLLEIARGEEFYQEQGSLRIEGEALIGQGGSLFLNGGEIVNNGHIRSDKPLSALDPRLAELPGSGTLDAPPEAQSGEGEAAPPMDGEAIAALPDDPEDTGALDEYGLTPRERAYVDAADFLTFGRPDPETYLITPYLDAETYRVIQPADAAYLVRDMTVEGQPLWAEGFSHIIVAPEASVTLEGDDWTENLAITILPGGELTVDGEVHFLALFNAGTLTVNGSLAGDQGDGAAGSSGSITVNGSFAPRQYFRFQGAEESGRIDAGMTVDLGDMEPPFRAAHGTKSMDRFAAAFLSGDPSQRWWEP